MDSGRVLATDAPLGLIVARGAATLEEAFISYLEEATGSRGIATTAEPAAAAPETAGASGAERPPSSGSSFSLRRLVACTIRETPELVRDPIRLGFALFGTTFLMLVFGFGISTDVNSLTFAVLDHDQSHESRAYLEELRGSSYFVEKPSLTDYADLEKRLASGDIGAGIEIPPGFGRDIARGRSAWAAAWIDGARPFIAQTIRGYLEAMHQLYLADPAVKTTQQALPQAADVAVRFKYNQDFQSVYAMVPAQLAMQLALFPAILMALAIVREKELGSITNLYVTPVTRLEFLLGKQVPYVGLAMVNFALMFTMALFVFEVPLKGSFLTLLLGTLIYVSATTAYGMLVSAFARTQIAALFGTAILTVLPATMFAGMMVPVSSLSGMARIMGRLFPMTYFSAGQRRHLYEGARLFRPCRRARGFYSGLDAREPSVAAQPGTLGLRRYANARQYFLARHKGIAQFHARFRAAGAGRLRVFAGHHRASGEQLARSPQRIDRDRRRGPFGAVVAHRACVSAALFPDAAADRRAGYRAERRKIYVRCRHPPEFRPRRARPPTARGPTQRRCHRNGSGGARSRLCSADHHDRGRQLPVAGGGHSALAGKSRRAHRFQPECRDLLVHQCHGHHQ